MTQEDNAKLIDSTCYAELISRSHKELNYQVHPILGHQFVAHLDIAEPLLPGPIRSAVEVTQRYLPTHLKPKALFLGTPFEPYRQDDVLSRFTSLREFQIEVESIRQTHNTQCVVMTNITPTHRRISDLLRANFTLLPSFPDMVINLRQFKTFDLYLDSLKPEDRSSVRRKRRVFGERGYTIKASTDASKHAGEIYQAYLPFFERAKVKWFPHSQAFFQEVTKLGSTTRLFLAYDSQGRVAGFSMGFFCGGIYHAGRLGVRPDLHQRDRVYFALLYRFIEDAIDLGAQSISLEPTAYRLKRHLGAHPKPVVNAIMGQSNFWRSALALGKPLGHYVLRHLNRLRMLEANY